MQKQRYIDVDYHRRYSYMTVMDEEGKIAKDVKVANYREVISTFLSRARCDGNCAAVLEASRNWLVMYDWLEEPVDEVHLAPPFKVKAIAQAKIKTNKIDARVLAHLLRSNLLPEAYVLSPETRQARDVLRQRMLFVKLRTIVKNRFSALLGYYPELAEQRPCKDIFSQKGLSWLKQIPVKDVDRKISDGELELRHALEKRISQSDSLVKKLAQGDWRLELLKTIPGLCEFFSVFIAYEVDDIRRFRNEKKFFSYMGIIPPRSPLEEELSTVGLPGKGISIFAGQ